jgi:23S rRNA (guanine745-N1)-methyltransferase
MLNARRRFLDAGHYQPLSDALNTLIIQALSSQTGNTQPVMLDVGCGEGYYLGRLTALLSSLPPRRDVHYLGLDVSKEAVRMAARRYKSVRFIVADVKDRLVLADSAIDVLLDIFAPRNVAEFARVLAPRGTVLVVIPGARHLLQLREALPLIGIQENKPRQVEAQFAPLFTLCDTTTTSYTASLTREEIAQLVMMTPNYWHQPEKLMEQIEGLDAMELAVEFVCMVFQRRDV